ncbi:MAG: FAD-dependent oxidoreductase [Bacteroidota bacterium]
MHSNPLYDVIIIGGGIAGLSAAIRLASLQHKVLVLEKDIYPKHKVCGEYISMESGPFLRSLGLQFHTMQLPQISKLHVTDNRGNEVKATLTQGGIGISRYKLDAALAELAEQAGATIITKARVDSVDMYHEQFSVTAAGQTYIAKAVCGTWGKRSNMDVKWQRKFLDKTGSKLSNYIGIKHHISYPWPQDLVAMHNFPGGYCGVSPVEDGRTCFCYLTTAASLSACGNDIKQLESTVLGSNPWLKEILSKAELLYQSPLAISQISFDKKEPVYQHVLMLGDAAGMITPLCGKGMSMALRSARLATEQLHGFLSGDISRIQMEQQYTATWNLHFSRRLSIGRMVQRMFGRGNTTALFLKAANAVPALKTALINSTNGTPF